MRAITVNLPKALFERIEREARRKRTTKSEIVRKALEITRSDRRKGRTCLDLAGDVVGSFDGPRDLSTNKSYLKRLKGPRQWAGSKISLAQHLQSLADSGLRIEQAQSAKEPVGLCRL